MPSVEELEDAIEQLEDMPSSFDNCLKLAVYKSLLKEYRANNTKGVNEPKYRYKGDTEFMEIVNEVGIDKTLEVVDELLSCIQLTTPKLYNSAIYKLKN